MRTTEERLSALENQVRTYRRLSLLLLLLLSVGIACAQVQDKEKVIVCDVLKAKKVTADSIELVSQEGVKAGTLITAQGLDIRSESLDGLQVRSDGLRIMVASQPVVMLVSTAKSTGALHLSEIKGKRAVHVGVQEHSGVLTIYNKLGNTSVLLAANPDGHGEIWTMDMTGKKGRAVKSGK